MLWLKPALVHAQSSAVGTWVNKGHSNEKHTADEIDEVDFLWQELEGRCCFAGEWDYESEPEKKWISVDTCKECDIWGQPDTTCHSSARACAQCGMGLYCPGKPPPLLGGNKVCTGASRVGEGCTDAYRMGVCLDKGNRSRH